METIKCLVVDDEELARKLITSYIEKIDFLELVAAVPGAFEAMRIMNNDKIDLLFLDIQMPDLKGTDLAKTIDPSIEIIFTTAYSEYALEGFELNALDYLLKPITFERFLIAINKTQKHHETPNLTKSTQSDSITVKSGYDYHKIKFETILYIQSDSEYVVFHCNEKNIMSHQSLKSLEKELPENIFMRVHRSYIINKEKVQTLKGNTLIIANTKIPVSNSYYDTVKETLFGRSDS